MQLLVMLFEFSIFQRELKGIKIIWKMNISSAPAILDRLVVPVSDDMIFNRCNR